MGHLSWFHLDISSDYEGQFLWTRDNTRCFVFSWSWVLTFSYFQGFEKKHWSCSFVSGPINKQHLVPMLTALVLEGDPQRSHYTSSAFWGDVCLINTLDWIPLPLLFVLFMCLCSTGRTTCGVSTGCSGTPLTQNWLYWLEITTSGSTTSKRIL